MSWRERDGCVHESNVVAADDDNSLRILSDGQPSLILFVYNDDKGAQRNRSHLSI